MKYELYPGRLIAILFFLPRPPGADWPDQSKASYANWSFVMQIWFLRANGHKLSHNIRATGEGVRSPGVFRVLGRPRCKNEISSRFALPAFRFGPPTKRSRAKLAQLNRNRITHTHTNKLAAPPTMTMSSIDQSPSDSRMEILALISCPEMGQSFVRERDLGK